MGTKELRKRETWQDISGPKAAVAEGDFYAVFLQEFQGSEFTIRKKPKEFRDIYSKVKLSKNVMADIYTPKDEKWIHGLVPDFAIDNTKTKKTLYVEVKRQDGWVEGKPRKAGRGNAHERSCKFFTPGLLKILRKKGNLGEGVLPFWVVFKGDIARDPKRVREITTWYDGYSKHFFIWSNPSDIKSLVDHFNKKLRHLLNS